MRNKCDDIARKRKGQLTGSQVVITKQSSQKENNVRLDQEDKKIENTEDMVDLEEAV